MATKNNVISMFSNMADPATVASRPGLREKSKRKLGKKGKRIRAYAILAGLGITAIAILLGGVALVIHLVTWVSGINGESAMPEGDAPYYSAYISDISEEEDALYPTADQIAEYNRNYELNQVANFMVANYVRFGTAIDSYQHGTTDEELAFYAEALALAQASIDMLPDKVILPEAIYIELTDTPRARLDAEQMGNLDEAYGFFTRGFDVLPNYLSGLDPHIVAGIMGNLGAGSSFLNDTSGNGRFGVFQLGPELYQAYEVWCTRGGNTEIFSDVWHQCAFVWDVLNGWGYGTCITLDYSQTLADLLASETAAEAATVLNAGMDADPNDGVDGFFRGTDSQRRVEWAEQIYEQLLEVRP